jgi:hypothetical protein
VTPKSRKYRKFKPSLDDKVADAGEVDEDGSSEMEGRVPISSCGVMKVRLSAQPS